MSSFKTKTIALIASSLIVAVAGLSFATTPAVAKTKNTKSGKQSDKAPARAGTHTAVARKTPAAPANKALGWRPKPSGVHPKSSPQ